MQKPARKALSDETLLRILKREEADASSHFNTELAAAQADAMNRYYARPYGNEKKNRSQAVTHDIEDAINWIMPDLMRTMADSHDLISVEASNPEDENNTQIAADYLRHILFRDNPGETIIYDVAFDGLLQRQGVVRVAWEDPEPKPPKVYEGLSGHQMQRYLSDQEYEILEADQNEDGSFSARIVHRPRMGRVLIEAVPPEEFAACRSARSIKTADYHRRKRQVWKAEVERIYDTALLLMGDDGEAESDPRTVARSPDETSRGSDQSGDDDATTKVWLIEEYTRIDADGDGIVELLRTVRVGDQILEREAVDCTDYVVWTPIRISHKISGRSVADVLLDIQKIRTQITRFAMDGLAQSLTPQKAVNISGLDDGGADALLDNEVGGFIPTKRDPREVVQPIVTPDVSASALTWLEYFEQKGAEASGVTKQAQGMDPQAMNKTATGIDLLQAAAKVRIEMVARWLKLCVEEMLGNALYKIIAYQDASRAVKIGGKWIDIDPRSWSDEMGVTVHIGEAGVSRQQSIANLMIIGAEQDKVIAAYGPSNPVCGVAEWRHTRARVAELMGQKSPEKFFKEVPEGYEAPPQQDPKQAEAAAKLQLEQAKAQGDMQLKQADLQHRTRMAEVEFTHKARMSELQAATDREIAGMKVAGEMDIARIRIAAETEIARERMQREDEIARMKADREYEVAKMKARSRAKARKVGNGSDGGTVRMGGQIG